MGLFSGITKAIGGALGSIVSAGVGYLGQKSANDTNIDLAQMSNQTAIDLANTSYQRRVKDLTAAGLNPMLAYTQGGAQTPNLNTARVENTADAASRVSLGTSQQQLLRAQVETQESQSDLNSAQAAKVLSEKAAIDMNNIREGTNLDTRTFVEAKELDARQAKALLTRLESSIGENSQRALLEVAHKHGYRTMEEATQSVAFRQQLLDLYQSKLRSSELESFSDMYKSSYGKNIAPYLNSARDLSGFGSGVRSLRNLNK